MSQQINSRLNLQKGLCVRPCWSFFYFPFLCQKQPLSVVTASLAVPHFHLPLHSCDNNTNELGRVTTKKRYWHRLVGWSSGIQHSPTQQQVSLMRSSWTGPRMIRIVWRWMKWTTGEDDGGGSNDCLWQKKWLRCDNVSTAMTVGGRKDTAGLKIKKGQ